MVLGVVPVAADDPEAVRAEVAERDHLVGPERAEDDERLAVLSPRRPGVVRARQRCADDHVGDAVAVDVTGGGHRRAREPTGAIAVERRPVDRQRSIGHAGRDERDRECRDQHGWGEGTHDQGPTCAVPSLRLPRQPRTWWPYRKAVLTPARPWSRGGRARCPARP